MYIRVHTHASAACCSTNQCYLAMDCVFNGSWHRAIWVRIYMDAVAMDLFRNRPSHDDTLGVVMHGLWVAYFGSFLSETVLYPLETHTQQ